MPCPSPRMSSTASWRLLATRPRAWDGMRPCAHGGRPGGRRGGAHAHALALGATGAAGGACARAWQAAKGTQRIRGLADIGPRPRYRVGRLGLPDPATPGPRGAPFRNSFPLALLLAQRHRSARALRAGAGAGGRTGGRRAARPSSWAYRGTGGYRCRHGTPSSCRCRSLSLLLAAERAHRGLLKPLGVTRAVSLDTIACS